MHVLQNVCIQKYLDDAVLFRKPCPWLRTEIDMVETRTRAVGTGYNCQIVAGIAIDTLF